MENLPLYVSIILGLTTLLTLLFLHRACNRSKFITTALTLWLFVQAFISLTGFYKETFAMPPRFGLLILPPLLLMGALFITKKGRSFIDGVDVKILTALHVIRIPVEIVLFLVFLHKGIPEIMTFEGRNFDILSGLTAPIIYYFGFVKKRFNVSAVLIWNFACLALLINIVGTAILSVPTPFQKFGFEQPNVAVLFFPFTWLPCFIVPVVLFAHLVTIRKIITSGEQTFLSRGSLIN